MTLPSETSAPPDLILPPGEDSDVSDAFSVDPRLLDKPLKALQAIARGNGIDPGRVALISQKVASVRFTATLRIKLSARIAKREVPGKDVSGEVAHDETALHFAVDRHLQTLTQAKVPRQTILDIALKRSDQGFGLKLQSARFKTLSKAFVMYGRCPVCQHHGVVVCPSCRGEMKVLCPSCRGSRQSVCPACHGNNPSCRTCGGDGRAPCQLCRGTGRIPCKPCGASGRLKCTHCAATGWRSTLLLAEVESAYTFSILPQGLPPDVLEALEARGSRVVEKSLAEVRVAHILTHEEDKTLAPDELMVTYQGQVPFGPVEFQVGDETVSALLFGYHGELLRCTAFLERGSAREACTHLATAAAHPSQAAALLPRAAQMRFIRDALQAGMMASRAKALTLYRNRYPYGLSDAKRRTLLAQAERALLSACRMARWSGIATGYFLALAVWGGYYLGPGMAAFSTLVGSLPLQVAGEVLLFVFLAGALYFLPRLFGAFALRRILGPALPGRQLRSLLPPARAAEWAALAGLPAVLALILVVQKTTGGVSPAWLPSF